MPLALGACIAVAAWRKVRRPILFLCFAVLTLLGIQAVALLFIAGLLPPGEPNSAYVQSTGLVAIIVAVIGSPLLWFLYRGLRHASNAARGA